MLTAYGYWARHTLLSMQILAHTVIVYGCHVCLPLITIYACIQAHSLLLTTGHQSLPTFICSAKPFSSLHMMIYVCLCIILYVFTAYGCSCRLNAHNYIDVHSSLLVCLLATYYCVFLHINHVCLHTCFWPFCLWLIIMMAYVLIIIQEYNACYLLQSVLCACP